MELEVKEVAGNATLMTPAADIFWMSHSNYHRTPNFLRSSNFCVFERFLLIAKIEHTNISLLDWLCIYQQQETQKRKDSARKGLLFYRNAKPKILSVVIGKGWCIACHTNTTHLSSRCFAGDFHVWLVHKNCICYYRYHVNTVYSSYLGNNSWTKPGVHQTCQPCCVLRKPPVLQLLKLRANCVIAVFPQLWDTCLRERSIPLTIRHFSASLNL